MSRFGVPAEQKNCAAGFGVFRFEYDVVATSDGLGNGEAETGAAFAVCAEAIKDMGQRFAVYAGAVVLDGDMPLRF